MKWFKPFLWMPVSNGDSPYLFSPIWHILIFHPSMKASLNNFLRAGDTSTHSISHPSHPEMNKTEKLCLTLNDFGDNLKHAFETLRSDKDFSDVTLVCEDGQQDHPCLMQPSFHAYLQKHQTFTSLDLHEGLMVSGSWSHIGLCLLWRSKHLPTSSRLFSRFGGGVKAEWINGGPKNQWHKNKGSEAEQISLPRH